MAHNDYDQYTDQLLNSVFENAKQTSEDQFVNQLLQNLRLSNQTPVVNNDWLLLQQQLQQQKELLEKLTSNTTNTAFQIPVVKEETPALDQKIPRVPVQPSKEIVLRDIKDTNTISSPPPVLEKRKSFLKRALSRNKQFTGKPEGQARAQPHPQLQKVKSSPPTPQIQRRPSFWRPREERPKGWWKGKANQAGVVQSGSQIDYDDDYEYEYEQEYDMNDNNEDDEDEEEEEEEEVYIPPPQLKKKKRQPYQQQRIVTRRAVEPKKVTSIKKQRQMVFKGPSLRKKNKVTTKKGQSVTATTAPATASPVYMMPQQPMYYQQPMMMPQQQYMAGNGYYYPSPIGYTQPSYTSTTTSSPEVSRKKHNPSVFNPREATNDKCHIM